MWPFGPRNNYPYTDFHELNTDWILAKIHGLEEAMKHFVVDTKDTIIETVNKWLDDHPEATTTVQDGAISNAKLALDAVDTDNIIDKAVTYSKLADDVTVNFTDPQIRDFSYTEGESFKVATFNVLGTNYFRWPPDPPCDTDKGLVSIVRNIQVINPDIVGLQEMSYSPKYTQLEKLVYTGYGNSHYLGNHNLGLQNTLLGDALMSKGVYPLANIVDTSWSDQADEKRHCIKAEISMGGKTVSVYVTHLSLVYQNRYDEITAILGMIANDPNEYKIVMGDMNFDINSADYNRFIDAGLVNTNNDKATYPENNSIIDFIFHTSNISVLDYDTVYNVNASDHALLWAEMKLN